MAHIRDPRIGLSGAGIGSDHPLVRRYICTYMGLIRSRILVFVAFAVLGMLQAHAQDGEHPFIKTFTLTVLDGRVQVDWTMQGGSTCNGSEVLRSTDGVMFEVVHRIDGICGDPNVAVPFSWIDTTPPEFSTVYYRINLGFDGFSSIKTIVFKQLLTSDQRFYPSPMRDEATLLLNVPASSTVQLSIWDAAGHLLQQHGALPGPALRIALPGHGPGVYTYVAISEGRTFTGRFVKE